MASKAKHNHTVVAKTTTFLAKTPKAKGVTLAKDKDGYFCYTHRARSNSYKSIGLIPKSIIEKIEATG